MSNFIIDVRFLAILSNHLHLVLHTNPRRIKRTEEYLKLLDFTGRQIRDGKEGAIPADLAPILERLGIEQGAFVMTVKHFPNLFRRMAGRVEQMTERAAEAGRRWLQGVRHAARAFT